MIYDLIIIGGGPAGLSAGLYAGRARLKAVIIERGIAGGQVATTNLIENYPGFPNGIGGMELAQLMEQQAMKFGVESAYGNVTGLRLEDNIKVVLTEDGSEYRGRAVIIATGADHVKLGVPGEERLAGRGVSYCAICDGAFFQNQDVAVIGGGDSAIDEGLYLTRVCRKVTVVHRRDQLRAEKVLQERAFATANMAFVWNHVVESIEGQEAVEKLILRHVKTGEKSELAVSGVFIYVGLRPNTAWLQGGPVAIDANGYIPTNARMETNVPGVYAVGDVRQDSLRQAIIAAGEGATAMLVAEKYLEAHR